MRELELVVSDFGRTVGLDCGCGFFANEPNTVNHKVRGQDNAKRLARELRDAGTIRTEWIRRCEHLGGGRIRIGE
jgi:hypothetical protein